MDTQFDWLGSLQSNTSSQSSNGAPPMELTLEESKTYMRWYLDILARTNLRTIAISDVYQFLGNFKISSETKEQINRIFSKILLLINIGEFFALLRVVSHALQGQTPVRPLIKKPTSVPVPPSILSKKRQNEENEEDTSDDGNRSNGPYDPQPAAPLDLDLFTQFMLTGERPNEKSTKKKLKKLKAVTFSDEIVTDIRDTYRPAELPLQEPGSLDYSLPMDQLLSRINASTHLGQNQQTIGQNLAVPSRDGRLTSPDPEEKQILRDMEPQMNHFRNLHSVDTILVDGVPANIHLQENSDFRLPQNALPPLLRPNMTGPAQMAQMSHSESFLRPNMTGPLDMARYMSEPTPKISLQAFTSQMTGNTLDNTELNARIGHSPAILPPPVPATRRARLVSQPSPLNHTWERNEKPANLGMTDHFSHSHFSTEHLQRAGPPVPPRSPLGQTQKLVPHHRRPDYAVPAIHRLRHHIQAQAHRCLHHSRQKFQIQYIKAQTAPRARQIS
ncbi:hypothetical protein HF325_002952 [Metschnikowia pulcherrima]|uniref:Uncharacterized protein n=1 Tax=Metschnikowia pulcherrima TaxID=27326 RepID=A0A8H7GSX0_9ASCO|nr:hypothetical protein HF325_002952 [Metschnikowia pulcherrima]